MNAPDFEHSDVIVCPGGPMLVRGRHTWCDEDGVEHHTTAPISAVCRCGFSARAPWCDGTHKSLPEEQRP
jgi:CDGSH-type Zn-finger protein